MKANQKIETYQGDMEYPLFYSGGGRRVTLWKGMRMVEKIIEDGRYHLESFELVAGAKPCSPESAENCNSGSS